MAVARAPPGAAKALASRQNEPVFGLACRDPGEVRSLPRSVLCSWASSTRQAALSGPGESLGGQRRPAMLRLMLHNTSCSDVSKKRLRLIIIGILLGIAPGHISGQGGAESPETEKLQQEKLKQEIRKLQHENRKLQGEAGKQSETKKLQRDKLEEEVRKLRQENDLDGSILGWFLKSAPFLAVLVAIFGAIFTLRTQIHEISQRKKEENAQREREDQRRSDGRFTDIVKNLGSESEALQASALASLGTFLKSRYQDFNIDTFLLLCANLKIKDRSRAIKDLMIRIFQEALKMKLEPLAGCELWEVMEGDRRAEILDLSRADLVRIDLRGLNFKGLVVDVAFADLRGARLTDTWLPRARGFGANLEKASLSRSVLREARFNNAKCSHARFHDADLISATFKGADLGDAQFQRARLQSVHFEGADLRSARFENADISDAYFFNAKFNTNGPALKSITKARNWRSAHFSRSVRDELEEIAQPTPESG